MKKLIGLLVLTMILLSCENNEPELQIKTVDFYSWDMTTSNEFIVFNPIHFTRVESIEIAIFDDFRSFADIDKYDLSLGGYSTIEYNKIIITLDGNFFNSEEFNSIEQIRGQVYIKYY